MKKKICLMVILAVVTVAGVVSEEVNTGPNKDMGIFNSWVYYTGKLGSASYKLDWDAFYKRMDKYADTSRYKYIHIAFATIDSTTAELYFGLSDGTASNLSEGACFSYRTNNGQVLLMVFSDFWEYSDKSTERYSSYSDAVKAWNYYLEYM